MTDGHGFEGSSTAVQSELSQHKTSKGLGLRGWINSLFTEDDDRTPDAVNVLWAVGVFTFLGLAAWTVYKTSHFDMAAFGVGFGTTMATGAGAKWMKQKGNF